MKKSKTTYLFALAAIAVFMLFYSANNAYAQTESRESRSVSISTGADGKVTLKVKVKDGNDETNFEKSYDSYEEMRADPDLEKYGIDLNNFGFGGNSGNGSPKFFFHNGPGGTFWDEEMESLRERMEEMMQGFGSFNFDHDNFMDVDSLMNKFNFQNKNGQFFFNGNRIMDIDSLRDALKDQYGSFKFDFDFGDWDDEDFGSWSYGGQDEDDTRVITRAHVFIRSAKKEDKEVSGTADMQPLELRDISFYPNPSDGRFDVELETGSNSSIHTVIVDKNGNEVYNAYGSPSGGYYDFKVDLSREGKGLYILKIVQDGRALTKRIIVE